jgi:non-ribosomal peptide synthetase component F
MSDDQQGYGPASLAQQGVWLHEQRGDLRAAYHLPFTLSFRGHLDRAALLDACRAVIARNPILASAFSEPDTTLRLIPADRGPEITVTDFRGAPAAKAGALLADAMRDDILRRFDLRHGPLIRITLFALSERRHVLLVIPHHLVFDGVSVDLFKRELAACYRALLTGEPPGPATAYPAADYVAEETRRLAAALPAARAFWRERWREPAEVALPGLLGTPPDVSAGDCIAFTLGKRQHARFREAAGGIGVTRFEFLLASLYALLRRYRNAVPVIGITLGLRTQETMNSIGFFSHEVPLAQRVDPALGFRDFTLALRADLRRLYRFRTVPVSRAVPGVSPAAAQAPVIISYRRHDRTVDFPGLQVTSEWQFNFAARDALWIQVLDESENLRVFLRYAPRVIAKDSADRIAGHWRRLLCAAIASPSRPLGTLALLAREEREQQLTFGGRSSRQAAVRHPATLPGMFSAPAAASPGKIAAVCGEEEVSYRRLEAESDSLARRLRCSGVGRESLVVIRARPSIGMLTGQLAVLKAGAAYLALAPGCPAGEVAEAVAATGACAVLVDGRPSGPGEVPAISLGDRGCACGGCAAGAAPGPSATMVASVIRTPSARQADRPCWVAIGHSALAGRLATLRDLTRTGPAEAWLAHAPPSSGVSAIEMFLPLLAGARVIIAREQDRDAAGLLRLIRRHRVTHAQATTAGWRLLLDAGFGEPGVTAIAVGETLPPSLARRIRRGAGRLLSVSGQPETVVWATYAEIPPDPAGVTGGGPMAGARACITGEWAEMLPAGSAGELCIGGQAIARGYLGDPAATAERFTADPHGPPGSRLFRTGHRARYRPDGHIEFLGRISDSVTLRGHRIEPGRIEARLAAHPGVLECAVAPRRDESAGRGVAAYFVPTPGEEPSPASLKSWLAETLPRPMVPEEYVPLGHLPLTADGNIDTELIPRPPGGGSPPSAGEPLPGTEEVQQDVTRILRDIPRLKNIGPAEDMFSLGVNSLTIAQIAARIRLNLKVDIPAESFYESPTIMGIASVVTQARARQRGTSA